MVFYAKEDVLKMDLINKLFKVNYRNINKNIV